MVGGGGGCGWHEGKHVWRTSVDIRDGRRVWMEGVKSMCEWQGWKAKAEGINRNIRRKPRTEN